MHVKPFRRIVTAAAAVLLVVAFSGCGNAPPLADTLKAKGAADVSAAPAEIRYLADTKGANYLFTAVAGGSADMNTLIGYLLPSKSAQKPADKQYTPELRCDCEIAIGSVTLYYDTKENLLVYPDIQKGKDKDTVRYRYYTPDAKLAAFVLGLKPGAKRKVNDSVKPFRSLEELKASVGADELAEQGQEINFEFYSGEMPAYAGTACCVYTTAGFASIPADRCLIMAYGKSPGGKQEKLSIVGLEANTHYTKILVSQPDDALDSVDTGEEEPDAYAIAVDKSAIDIKKWLVFVDDSNRIIDVILPEDIEGMDQPGVLPGKTPDASAIPADTPEPDAIE